MTRAEQGKRKKGHNNYHPNCTSTPTTTRPRRRRDHHIATTITTTPTTPTNIPKPSSPPPPSPPLPPIPHPQPSTPPQKPITVASTVITTTTTKTITTDHHYLHSRTSWWRCIGLPYICIAEKVLFMKSSSRAKSISSPKSCSPVVVLYETWDKYIMQLYTHFHKKEWLAYVKVEGRPKPSHQRRCLRGALLWTIMDEVRVFFLKGAGCALLSWEFVIII